MDCAMSITKRSLVFAKDCNYKSWQLLLLCCPYCLQPVYLRDGDYNVAHFAHYDSGSKGLKYVYCPIRNSTGNPRYTDVELGIHRQQTMLEYFGYFSYHFDEFIGYDNTEAVKIDYEVLKRLRMLMNKEFGDKEFVKRIVSENMRKFMNNTLSRFIEKKGLSSEVILTLLNDALYKDLLRDNLLHKYLVCVSKFLKYFYTHYGRWNFPDGRCLCSHLLWPEDEINEAYLAVIERKKWTSKTTSLDNNRKEKTSAKQKRKQVQRSRFSGICPYCKMFIRENDIRHNLEQCKKKYKKKDIDSIKSAQGEIQQDLLIPTNTDETYTYCPYCNCKVRVKIYQKHITLKCPKKPVIESETPTNQPTNDNKKICMLKRNIS